MPDIRQRVEEDRGLLKKIQLIIPGSRGYRIREDLRDSDKMLRQELNKRLGLQHRQLEEFRLELVRSAPMSKNLELLGGIVNQYKKVEGLVAHGESGYSGIAADIKIGAEELNHLYDYDLSIMENINFIDQSLGDLKSSIDSGIEQRTKDGLGAVKMRITGLEEKFSKRISIIQGTGL
jgi:hypothetical protein